MTPKDLEECAKSRTKGRIPMLSYYCKYNGATLWRSSQPKEGLIGGVTRADKKMMKSIANTSALNNGKTFMLPSFLDPKKESATLHIYDARSKIAAFGNKIRGSGYENISEYPFAWLKFCDIGNIHTMRDSYIKMLALCNDPKGPHWFDRLDRCAWLCHISNIIRSAKEMADSINAFSAFTRREEKRCWCTAATGGTELRS